MQEELFAGFTSEEYLASRKTALPRAIRRCYCGKQFYGMSKTCSKKCKEKQRLLDGRNSQRMKERAARKLGFTVEEYELQLERKRLERGADAERQAAIKSRHRAYRSHRKLRGAVNAQRRAALLSAYMLAKYHADPDNWSTRKKRRRLFERDGWRCRVCKKKVSDQVHRTHPRRAVAMHIQAKATGGEWTDENMATGCYECNVADGVNKIPIQTHL